MSEEQSKNTIYSWVAGVLACFQKKTEEIPAEQTSEQLDNTSSSD